MAAISGPYISQEAAANLTLPPRDGLEGILYNRGLSCNAEPLTITEEGFPKIPLIALIQRGGCTFASKILLAQKHGAVAVIVYDRDPDHGTSFERKVKMVIPRDSGIEIPAFYVNSHTGRTLHRLLEDSTKAIPKVVNGTKFSQGIRVYMYPTSPEGRSSMELAMIIVITLLVLGFCTSLGIHWCLWRRRMVREISLDPEMAMTEELPMGKELLDPSKISLLLTRTIVTAPPASHFLGSTHQDSSSSANTEENVCVICLEGMIGGDTVRGLPCKHEYHAQCIDPWLTCKSGECPLCKENCVEALKKLEAKKRSIWRKLI
ncbi:hypothetical protein CLU79DRAFT_844001 [Phycomyces nitens]|nr:hypothetical protein CLU79DRAFT_844001 [Phycomyces nitens]